MAPAVPALNRGGRGDLAQRKLVELRDKVAGIEQEFDAWVADSASGMPLRKHRTQIERLTDQLRGLSGTIAGRIDALAPPGADGAPPAAGDVLAQCRRLQAQMLEIHRLWDYYRSKLSLRHVAWFRDYLAIADEFAWACYEPAQKAASSAGGSVRAAPLIFLSGDFSPFTYGRRTEFEGLLEPLSESPRSRQFNELVRALPVPVIGVPWYQVSHLPDAPLIAHEVGHDVEEDFGLTTTITEHLAQALVDLDEQQRYAWEGWAGEIWADLYGVLAVGPAFVAAMADLLVTDPAQVASEARSPSAWDAHPPASLRIRLMTLALRKTGFRVEALAHRCSWRDSFGLDRRHPLLEVASDVVDALLDGIFPQLGGKCLPDALRFSSEQHEAAQAVMRAALADLPAHSGDIRSLVAGARLAFDTDPARYVDEGERIVGATRRIVQRALQTIGDAPRSAVADERVTPEDDRKAGEALFAQLEQLVVPQRQTEKGEVP